MCNWWRQGESTTDIWQVEAGVPPSTKHLQCTGQPPAKMIGPKSEQCCCRKNPVPSELETHTSTFEHPRASEGIPSTARGPGWKVSFFMRLLLSYTAPLLLPFWKRYSEGCFAINLWTLCLKGGKKPFSVFRGGDPALYFYHTEFC